MKNPDLPESIWAELNGRLWHATDLIGLRSILSDRCIRVAMGDRYINSICRNMGCVSLFDFGPESEDQDDFMRLNWFPWLGSEHQGRCAIWLEIAREKVGDHLVGPAKLLQIVRTDHVLGRFFCGVEACHKGNISVAAIASALIIDRHDLSEFRRHYEVSDQLPDIVTKFAESLPPAPPEHPLVAAIRQRQQ